MEYKIGDIIIAKDDTYDLRKIKYIGKVIRISHESKKAFLKTIYTSNGKEMDSCYYIDNHFIRYNEAIKKGLGYEF